MKKTIIYMKKNEYTNPDFIIKPIEDLAGKENSYGLNSKFLKEREYLNEMFFYGR